MNDPIPSTQDSSEPTRSGQTSGSMDEIDQSLAKLEAESEHVVPTATNTSTKLPATVFTPQEHRSRLWLWIAAGVVGLIIAGVAITYFVSVSNAKALATQFTTDSKAYVRQVYTAANSSETDIDKIVGNIDTIPRPNLKSTFLSSTSNDYRKARDLSTDINTHVGDFKRMLDQYKSINHAYDDLLQLSKDLLPIISRADSVRKSQDTKELTNLLSDMSKIYKNHKPALNGIDSPSDMGDTRQQLVSSIIALTDAIDDVTNAIEANNESLATTSLKDMYAHRQHFDDASKALAEYRSTIPAKVRDQAKKLQEYGDKIK